jgi:hypothetical protein
MNVLEFYDSKHISVGDPIELEDDHYFCKLSYNQSPFIVKTNKVCYYKKKKTSNFLYISLTSKDYLEWFEKFYNDLIDKFHESSTDWFEDPLSKSDIECSFINPLKTNIKDNCFDIMCSIDENRIMITDTNDNMNTLDQLEEHEVVPTFHIKGVKFNSKHFSLEIELNHLYILLPSENEEEPEPVEVHITHSEPEPKTDPEPVLVPDPVPDPDSEISEYIMETSNLTPCEVKLDNLSIYKVYEFLNTRIKETMMEDIRGIFQMKKIKTKLDFSELVDDEEPDD